MLISAIWQIIFKIENITTFLQSDYLICLLNHAWPNLLSFLKTSSVYFPKAYQFASWKLKYRFQTHHLLRLNLCFSKCIEPIFIPDYNEKLDIKVTLYFINSLSTNWRISLNRRFTIWYMIQFGRRFFVVVFNHKFGD